MPEGSQRERVALCARFHEVLAASESQDPESGDVRHYLRMRARMGDLRGQGILGPMDWADA